MANYQYMMSADDVARELNCSKRKSWDTDGTDGWTVGSDGRTEDAGTDGMGEEDE